MLKKWLPALLLSLSAPYIIADELVIGVGQQGQHSLKDAKPDRGMTMDQVGQRYGEPLRIDGPTGNPPIESWHYEYFTVYYEGETVIHSVIKHVRQDAPQAKQQ